MIHLIRVRDKEEEIQIELYERVGLLPVKGCNELVVTGLEVLNTVINSSFATIGHPIEDIDIYIEFFYKGEYGSYELNIQNNRFVLEKMIYPLSHADFIEPIIKSELPHGYSSVAPQISLSEENFSEMGQLVIEERAMDTEGKRTVLSLIVEQFKYLISPGIDEVISRDLIDIVKSFILSFGSDNKYEELESFAQEEFDDCKVGLLASPLNGRITGVQNYEQKRGKTIQELERFFKECFLTEYKFFYREKDDGINQHYELVAIYEGNYIPIVGDIEGIIKVFPKIYTALTRDNLTKAIRFDKTINRQMIEQVKTYMDNFGRSYALFLID